MINLRWPARRGLGLAALVAVLAVVLPASPAAAHATLLSTDPAEGSVLQQTPSEIDFTFNETVRLPAGAVSVYDAEGGSVGSSVTSAGSQVIVDLDDDELPDGTYVVGWHVVSADGHPVSGSLTFSVGEASAQVTAPPPLPESSRIVKTVQGVLTGATYAGLLVAAGLACFVALVLPARFEEGRVRARLRVVARAAAAVGILAAVLLVPVAAVYAQGLELSAVFSGFDTGLVRNETGMAVLVAVGLGVVALRLDDKPPDRERAVVLLAGAGVALLAPALVGHTRAYQPEALLVVTDVAHLSAGAVWLGGLVGLGLGLGVLARREGVAEEVLARFSALAGGLLLAVVVTGTVLAWRILGSWSAFVDTPYGQVLLFKIGVALVVVVLAGFNRFRLLPRVRESVGFAERGVAARTVGRTAAAEAMLLVALLGLTGFLVNSSPRPAAVQVPAGQTGVEEGAVGDLKVLVLLDPRQQGQNTLLVQLQDESGEPVEPAQPPEVELRSGDLDLGRVELVSDAAGTYRATVLLPRPGQWEAQVSVREGKFDNPVTTVPFRVD